MLFEKIEEQPQESSSCRKKERVKVSEQGSTVTIEKKVK